MKLVNAFGLPPSSPLCYQLTEMERERILAGEQSAMKGSVRLSPSNLSAIEAPEFSSSESGDYNQGVFAGFLPGNTSRGGEGGIHP